MRAPKRSAVVGLAVVAAWMIFPRGFVAKSPPSSAVKKGPQYRLSSFAKYVEIAGATRVGSASCVSCHAEVASNFRHAFHAQQGVECEDCHGAGSLHVEAGGDVAKIVSFRSRSANDANAACLSCHIQDAKVRNWLAGAHAADGVRCTDCHQVHTQALQAAAPPRMNFNTSAPGHETFLERFVPESSVKLERRSATNDACLKCHAAQRAEMSLPYHHPLREGKLTCVDCHDPHGGPGGKNLRTANVNQLCLSCHAQYRGPFMYQHPPVNESCMNCHTPHGSPNTNLLTVSQPALCLQCHTGHHDGAGVPLADRCTDCHSSIHGSDVPASTGGSVFIDKGPFGVPGASVEANARRASPRPGVAALSPVAAHAATPWGLRTRNVIAASPPPRALHSGYLSPVPSHAAFAVPSMASFAGALAPTLSAFPGRISAATDDTGSEGLAPNSYGGLYFTPGAYRFLNVTGYGGRVGEYDSLRAAEGGDFEGDYVSVPHHLSLLTRGTVLTGSDFDIASQFTVGERLQVGGDLRSFVEQQDNYPFYASVISPDIVADQSIASGSVFGIKRRLGSAYARLKVPKLPVHLFVKGDWQARVGQTQLAWYDMGGDSGCNYCHYSSQFQSVNYTTRNIGGGFEVNRGGVDLLYEHHYSSFNDRLPFPSGTYGATLIDLEPIPGVPDTPPGTYALDIPAPTKYSADTFSLNWTFSPRLIFNGQATYRRARDVFTRNPQNAFDSDTALVWHPLDRLRIAADYRQQNLVNGFVPYYSLYGNMSYHEHWAGLKAEYELPKHLELETRYQRAGISRSNSFLWPQFYSPDNTDLRYVIPTSFRNTLGMALRYHPSTRWNARAGYEWTGTHAPGYLTEPKSNNRIFADVTLLPKRWLTFTNDSSIIVQNAFPTIQRRSRFYAETADATLSPLKNWNLDLGYSYQQTNLATYMAFNNDAGAGYVLDEPFVPYRQLSQSYWIRSEYKFKQRLGLNLALSHNSAHSGMRPDLNPSDFALMGNAPLVEQGVFDPDIFQQALGAVGLGATQVSQVNVPQLIGQGKVYYLMPHGFDAGILAYYGSYRDFTNPNLNGILRSVSFYFGRSW